MRIPQAADAGIGQQRVSPQGANAFRVPDFYRPYDVLQRSGQQVFEEALSRRKEIVQQEQQTKGLDLFKAFSDQYAQLQTKWSTSGVRGDAYRQGFQQDLDALTEQAEKDTDPAIWRYIGPTIIKMGIDAGADIDHQANQHVLDDTEVAVIQAVDVLRNQAIADPDRRQEYLASISAVVKSNGAALPPAKQQQIITNALSDAKEKSLLTDLQQRGAAFVSKRFDDYQFEPDQQVWARDQVQRWQDIERRQAEEAEAKRKREFNEAYDNKFDGLIIGLNKKAAAGTITEGDYANLLGELEAAARRGYERATGLHTNVTNMLMSLRESRKKINEAASLFQSGLQLDNDQTDALYQERRKDSWTLAEEIYFAGQSKNIPSAWKRRIASAVGLQPVASNMPNLMSAAQYVAGIYQDYPAVVMDKIPKKELDLLLELNDQLPPMASNEDAATVWGQLLQKTYPTDTKSVAATDSYLVSSDYSNLLTEASGQAWNYYKTFGLNNAAWLESDPAIPAWVNVELAMNLRDKIKAMGPERSSRAVEYAWRDTFRDVGITWSDSKPRWVKHPVDKYLQQYANNVHITDPVHEFRSWMTSKLMGEGWRLPGYMGQPVLNQAGIELEYVAGSEKDAQGNPKFPDYLVRINGDLVRTKLTDEEIAAGQLPYYTIHGEDVDQHFKTLLETRRTSQQQQEKEWKDYHNRLNNYEWLGLP